MFVLAIVLGPAEYGKIALLSVLVTLVTTVTQVGVAQSIVQMKAPSDIDLDTAFWSSCLFGTLGAAVLVMLPHRIAWLLGERELVLPVRMLSIVFLLEPIDFVMRGILQRELNMRILEIAQIVRTTTVSLLMIVLSIGGAGALSFVWGHIVGVFVMTLTLCVYFVRTHRWIPSFRFSRSSFLQTYRFGALVMAKGLLNHAARNVDEIIIRHTVGLSAVGFYSLGKNAVHRLVALITRVTSSVSYPHFAQVHRMEGEFGEGQLRATYLAMTKAVAGLLIPVFAFAATFLPTFVSTIAGYEWRLAGAVAAVFSVKAVIDVLSAGFATSVLYAKGFVNRVFLMDLFLLPVRFLAYWGAASIGGPPGVAVVFVGVVIIKAALLQQWANTLLKLNWLGYLGSMKAAVFTAAGCVGLSYVSARLGGVLFSRAVVGQVFLPVVVFAAAFSPVSIRVIRSTNERV